MRVFFCTNEERRVRNYMPRKERAKEYPALASLCRASLTVEAAFVLPIFLFSMLLFLYFMRLAQGYEQIQEALAITARAASQYGVVEKEGFYQYLEENSGSFSFIQDGKKGILFNKADISPVTEKIFLQVKYQVIFPVPYLGQKGITIYQEVKSRVFSGVTVWGEQKLEEREQIVYVAKYGTVYHFHKSCSYLNPSVQMVRGDTVFQRRNKKGGKYKPCGSCMKRQKVETKALYITDEGDYFHSSLSCMGLKRTIYERRLSEVIGLGVCNKCRD